MLESFNELVSEGLCLMSTDQGDIGWAHPNAQQKDEVWLLEGCTVPVVLRSQRFLPNKVDHATHTLIGQCYVVDTMEGEVWRKLKVEQLQSVVLS